MKKIVLMFIGVMSFSLAGAQFINEFHYDNTGTDVGEFIEVFIPEGDISSYSIILYNGSNGTSYDTDPLPSTCPSGSGVNCGATGTGCFLVINYPTNGIQNGSPDGIALVRDFTVIQFISYEGSFTATNGAANGMTSTDIGASQNGEGPIGNSLQLGPGGWEDNVSTAGACNQSQLPITLRSFDIRPMSASSVELAWVTESEENNSHFVIEHSTDGRKFEALDHMAGAGNSFEPQYYHFMHKTAARGQNYYRLKQVDFDGTFSYSPIRVVELKDGKSISLYPSLAQDELFVQLPEGQLYSSRVELININGQLVAAQQIEAGVDQQRLDISQLHPGYYMLRLVSADYEQSLRFVKQ